jgi:hypothetical protein
MSPRRAKQDFRTECPPIQHVKSFRDVTKAADLAFKYVQVYTQRAHADALAKKHAPLLKTSISRAPEAPLVVFDIDATLLNESEDSSGPVAPIAPIIALLKKVQGLGAHVALITARLDDPEMRKDTERTLRALGITQWQSLDLAPEAARRNMAAVSRWKHSKRGELARKLKKPIVLSVGDQWGDLLPIARDKDIDSMDTAFGVRHAPYQLVRPHDGFTMWGLKLVDKP